MRIQSGCTHGYRFNITIVNITRWYHVMQYTIHSFNDFVQYIRRVLYWYSTYNSSVEIANPKQDEQIAIKSNPNIWSSVPP